LQFKKWALYYRKKFGLLDWEFRFYHQDYDDKAVIATTDADSEAAIVSFWYSRTVRGIHDRHPRFTALHEVCHLLVDPLYAAAWDRWITKDQVQQSVEKVTVRITSIIEKLEGRC